MEPVPSGHQSTLSAALLGLEYRSHYYAAPGPHDPQTRTPYADPFFLRNPIYPKYPQFYKLKYLIRIPDDK